MKKRYIRLLMLGLVAMTTSAMASGVPVFSISEVANMGVDQFKSDDVKKLVNLHDELVRSTWDALGSPVTFSVKSMKGEMKKSLSDASQAVGTYDGLLSVLGPKSEYGEIKVKKCGGNADEVNQRIGETLAIPPKASEAIKLSSAEKNKRKKERAVSLERNATAGLAESWIAQAESADIAEGIANTKDELDQAESQMQVLATLLRLQEETQKNLNTRLSIMADDLTNTGLVALDSNM